MDKRDYYEVLGVSGMPAKRDQKRLPEIGEEISPGFYQGNQDAETKFKEASTLTVF